MVLNSSFNAYEPVVCQPEEVLNCFLRTQIGTEWLMSGQCRGSCRNLLSIVVRRP